MLAEVRLTGFARTVVSVALLVSLTAVHDARDLPAQQPAYVLAPTPAIHVESFGDSVPIGRLAGVTMLRNGALVIADESLLRVFVVGRDGRVSASLGRDGSGPGEFRLRYRFPRSDGPRPYGKSVHVAVSEQRVFVGTADSFFVEIYDLEGKRRGSIRRTAPLKRFNARDKLHHLRSISPLHASAEQKQRIRATVDAMSFPDYLPAYDRFLVDGSSRLWIAESYSAGEPMRQWWAFDENGVPRGSLRVPFQFEVLEFADSLVLGKWTDDDGAESIRGYRTVPVR